MWREMSYYRIFKNNDGDPFRIDELYDENIDNIEIEYNGFELDIIEIEYNGFELDIIEMFKEKE